MRTGRLWSLLLLLAGILAQEDMGVKVFLFPEEGTTAHVVLQPKVKKPLQQASICVRSYTELTRGYTLFSLATKTYADAILIFSYPPSSYIVKINNEFHNIKVDPEVLSWKQTCVTWDSTTGVFQLWVNRKPYPRRVINKRVAIEADMSIFLGQDQDWFAGGFHINDSFVGEISAVHMWDYALTPRDMFQDHQGNLINWKSLTYEIKGLVLVESDLQFNSN